MVAFLVERNQDFVPRKQVAHKACPSLDVVVHIALLQQFCVEEGVLEQDNVRQPRHLVAHLGHEMQVDLDCLQPTPTRSLCLPQTFWHTYLAVSMASHLAVAVSTSIIQSLSLTMSG